MQILTTHTTELIHCNSNSIYLSCPRTAALSLSLYIYIYVCINICICLCTYIYLSIPLSLYMYVCMYVCIHIYIYIYIYNARPGPARGRLCDTSSARDSRTGTSFWNDVLRCSWKNAEHLTLIHFSFEEEIPL